MKKERTLRNSKVESNSPTLFILLLDHFVCRPKLKPGYKASKKRGKKRPAPPEAEDESNDADVEQSPPKPKGRPPKSKGQKKKQWKKERGKKEDRTCPHCKRVFTSVLGKDYHVTNKVCTNPSKQKTKAGEGSTPFPTLEPGSKFVTPFGVVQVVSDTRETPVPTKKSATYRGSKSKSKQKGPFNVAIKSRVARGRLNMLYESGGITQHEINKAVYDGDPIFLAANPKKEPQSNLPKPVSAPEFPPESFPDRIVECVLIPDAREKVVFDSDSDDDESMEAEDLKMPAIDNDAATKLPFGMKLFLRRRDLTESYVASSLVYNCEDCGAPFGSKVGYNYHTRGGVCTAKAKRIAEANKSFVETVEAKANHMLKTQIKRRTRPDKKEKRRNVSVYPQVWLSLGFKFVAKKPPTKPKPAPKAAVEEEEEPLDDVLSRLKNELRREEDHKHGVMYPGVFDSLKFRRPPPMWKLLEEQEKQLKRAEAAAARKRKREAERQQQLKLLGPPPIVDIQVLADEVDTGRYPSIKRFDGEHVEFCSICKQPNNLLDCDFCEHAVHLDCMRRKHTIKDPEPQEDFMCHSCIQYVQDRRRRAEKRRLEKQEKALKKSGQSLLTMSAGLGVAGTEYHDVAALGHELRDLTELIRDAQGRLRQSIGVSKVNDTRRSMLL